MTEYVSREEYEKLKKRVTELEVKCEMHESIEEKPTEVEPEEVEAEETAEAETETTEEEPVET